MDFTCNKYRELISQLISSGYEFITYADYCGGNLPQRFVILRHDVDEQAHNALKMAKIEHDLGHTATYFFRIVKHSNKPEIIRHIAALGHEIGYHYEDLSTANGNYEKAITTFRKHLDYFRTYYPVKTVCMHGSSTSKYDNRKMWQKYNLNDYGLIGEPYLSTDFSKVFYLTDTGYAWDGGKYATRDVVENKFGITFHTTDEIIECIKNDQFPEQAMILAHTLWTDNIIEWSLLHVREFLRNHIKRLAMRNKLISVVYKKMVQLYWGKKE